MAEITPFPGNPQVPQEASAEEKAPESLEGEIHLTLFYDMHPTRDEHTSTYAFGVRLAYSEPSNISEREITKHYFRKNRSPEKQNPVSLKGDPKENVRYFCLCEAQDLAQRGADVTLVSLLVPDEKGIVTHIKASDQPTQDPLQQRRYDEITDWKHLYEQTHEQNS